MSQVANISAGYGVGTAAYFSVAGTTAGFGAADLRTFRKNEQRVAVIDPCPGGHHFSWMIEICLAFSREGKSVTALCPDPERLEAKLRELDPQAAGKIQAVSSEGMVEQVRNLPVHRRLIAATRNWANVQRALDALPRNLRPDSVFFAYVDCLLLRGLAPWVVDRVFTYTWSALYMSPTWMRTGRRLWPELATSVAWCLQADHCESIALIDEGLVDRFARLLPGKPVVRLPDFLPTISASVEVGESAEIRRLAKGRRIVGVVGSLQSRKGICTLLRLALEKPDSPFFFVFAGKLTIEGFSKEKAALWQEVIARCPENCFIRPTAIPDEAEYVALSNTCDIFYAAYRQFPNSSNALAWAAWLKKPIIVSAGHLMEERVRAYQLGAVMPEGDIEALWTTLQDLHDDMQAGNSQAEFQFDRYLQAHSIRRLEQGIRQINQTLSL